MIDPQVQGERFSAIPDVIRSAMGMPNANPHPAASTMQLQDAALAAYVLEFMNPRANPASDWSSGLNTRAFGNALAEGAQPAVIQAYNTQAEHLQFCRILNVKDAKPVSFPSLSADLDLEQVVEGAESKAFRTYVAGGSRARQLLNFRKIFTLSRIAVVNNSLLDWSMLLSGMGASVARTEARLIAAELKANPKLDDGENLFDAALFGNVQTGGLDTTNLGAGMAKMRRLKTPSGQPGGIRARFLLVAPEQELSALKIVNETGSGLVVVSMAGLVTGDWYLLADPAVAPSIGVMRYSDQKSPATVFHTKTPPRLDGTSIAIDAYLGAVAISRAGIVKGNGAS